MIEIGAPVGLGLGVLFLIAVFLVKLPRVRFLFGSLSALAFAYPVLIYPQVATSCRASNDRNAHATLKMIASIQGHFRNHDADGNGVKDYWRADIAGLYVVKECKLIEISAAGADDRPKTEIEKFIVRAPKAGYWYRALRFADEKELDPARWAACAFPDVPSAGPFTFLITQDGVVYRRKGRHPLELVPSPAELLRDWNPAER